MRNPNDVGWRAVFWAALLFTSTSRAAAQDCNTNNSLDYIDIQEGQSEDCNTDLIPDECQLFDGVPVSYTNNTDVVIPDDPIVFSTITASGNGIVTDVNVTVNIQHNFDADLDVSIGHMGISVLLFSDVGGGGDNFTGTVLDENVLTPITSGQAPFSGTFDPEGDLGLFNGQTEGGPWTLAIDDDLGGFTGTLLSWTLSLERLGETNDCNTNESPDECDISMSYNDDCNTNGIPDECELDCNTNGIPEECELTFQPPGGFAIDFDGVNDYMDAGSNSSLEITGPLTIELWVQVDNFTNTPRLIEFGGNGETIDVNFLYLLRLNPNGDVRMLHETGRGVNQEVFFDANLIAERWYHLAVVRDSSDLLYTLYVNGQFLDTLNYSQNPTGGTNGYLRIATNEIASSFFNGRIDEVRIWNVGRTAAQIAANFREPVPATSTGLVAYWKFDEGSGTLANDSDSAGVNDGTLFGGPAWISVVHADDCNTNGVPDECDLVEMPEDCDTNGVPDPCEVYTTTTGFPLHLSGNTTGYLESKVLDAPDDVFVSIGGQIVTYDFGDANVTNGPGPDFNVYEVDFGGAEFTLMNVLVSLDGLNFTSVKSSEGPPLTIPGDEAHGDPAFAKSYDLAVAGLAQARYVRVDGNGGGPAGTGFDLDAIGAAHLVLFDCNSNGVPDECDMPDCNTNGVPDECEPLDSDGDQLIDPCDNCPDVPNPDQADDDGDGVGNVCELPPRLFVDENANGANDGTSWVDAFLELRDAIDAADDDTADVDEIWVADGDYAPAPPGGSRAASFTLHSDLAIYGGFQSGETELSQRDPQANLTVLNGDLNGDDVFGVFNNAENSFHVVTAVVTSSTAVLDGFTVRGGNANVPGSSTGGGLYCNAASPLIVRCTLVNNVAMDAGGGAFCTGAGMPLFVNCRLARNRAASGGGAGVTNAQATFVNCEFLGNVASGTNGGGLSATFSNFAVGLNNCAFLHNAAAASGGGVYSPPGLLATNSIFRLNSDSGGMNESAQIDMNGGPITLAFCDVQGLTGGYGGVGNIDADPLFLDPVGPDGIPGSLDDDLRLTQASPCIDAGGNDAVPPDSADLDFDSDVFEPTPLDLGELPRFEDVVLKADTGDGAPPIVDMGAHETLSDCDQNGIPDDQEEFADCNTDLIPDACDIEAGRSADCNADGLPDECQNDCNCNGVDDADDIANGDSQDEDNNGVPDECAQWVSTAGLWSEPLSWDPPGVPDNDTGQSFFPNIAGNVAAVTLDINAEVNALDVVDGAKLNVTSTGNLTIESPAGIFNRGMITIGDGHTLFVGADFPHMGDGLLRLDGPFARISPVEGPPMPGGDPTLENEGTISGEGDIDAALINDGAIIADTPGGTLTISGGPFTNNAALIAQNGGTLQILVDMFEDVGGVSTLLAIGGTILINDGTEPPITLDGCGPIMVEPGSPGYVTVNNASIIHFTQWMVGDAQVGADKTATMTLKNGSSGGVMGPVVVRENGTLIVTDSTVVTTDLVTVSGGSVEFEGAVTTLTLTGGTQSCQVASWSQLEAAGFDSGPDDGYVGNFSLSKFAIDVDTAAILTDAFDNGNRGGGGEPEAVYADTLALASGAVLNLNGLHLYVGGVQIEPGPFGGGTIIDIPIPDPDPGDMNGDGLLDGEDVAGFVEAILGESDDLSIICAADLSGDGVVGPADVAGFAVLLLE